MSNNDSIITYLNKEPNLRIDTKFLFEYIDSLYKMYNRDKLFQFYQNIPYIFDKIFGISKFSGGRHNKKCLIDYLNTEYASYEELDSLLHLFIPDNDSIDGIKDVLDKCHQEYDGLDVVCAERFGSCS